jgi:hypothetical protein
MLRRCIDWLRRMQRAESVVVNLGSTRIQRLNMSLWIVLVSCTSWDALPPIWTTWLEVGLYPPRQDDPATRHRRQLAEPAQQPKKLSTREERNALRAKLKLPPQ